MRPNGREAPFSITLQTPPQRTLTSARLFSPMALSTPNVVLTRRSRKADNGSTRTWSQRVENHKANTATSTLNRFLSLRHPTASDLVSQESQESQAATPASPTVTPAVSNSMTVPIRKALAGSTGAPVAPAAPASPTVNQQTQLRGVTGMMEARTPVRLVSSQLRSRRAPTEVLQLRMVHLGQPEARGTRLPTVTGLPPTLPARLAVVHRTQWMAQAPHFRTLVVSLAITQHIRAYLLRTQAMQATIRVTQAIHPVPVVSRQSLRLYTAR